MEYIFVNETYVQFMIINFSGKGDLQPAQDNLSYHLGSIPTIYDEAVSECGKLKNGRLLKYDNPVSINAFDYLVSRINKEGKLTL